MNKIFLLTGAVVMCTSLFSQVPNKMSKNLKSLSLSNPSSSSKADFSLVFRDDFNSFDSSRWQLMTHSWPGNLAVFSPDTVSVRDGVMILRLDSAPDGTVVDGEIKPFLGAEVRSYESIPYGRVRARVKFAKGSAVVSSLVSIYTPWPADDWNEFDIESLGKNTSEIQFNSMVYTGPRPPISKPVSPTQYPSLQPLGFDSSQDFHIYTFEWTPKEAIFLIDDIVFHRWNQKMDLIGLPQNILLTIWASNASSWAGPVTDETANGEVIYDWVEVWKYNR